MAIPGTVQIPLDIKIDGDYAYIADQVYGIPVVNISNPSFPVVVSTYNTPGNSTGIFISGEYAYVCEYSGVIQVLDIADPTNLTFLAIGNANGPAFGIYAVDDYIYSVDWYSFIIFHFSTTNIEKDNSLIINLSAFQNFPNPFNAQTSIQYSLSEPSIVAIEIYDLLGRKVETFYEGEQEAGDHSMIWNAKSQSSGVFFYRIQAGDYSKTGKMVLLK